MSMNFFIKQMLICDLKYYQNSIKNSQNYIERCKVWKLNTFKPIILFFVFYMAIAFISKYIFNIAISLNAIPLGILIFVVLLFFIPISMWLISVPHVARSKRYIEEDEKMVSEIEQKLKELE